MNVGSAVCARYAQHRQIITALLRHRLSHHTPPSALRLCCRNITHSTFRGTSHSQLVDHGCAHYNFYYIVRCFASTNNNGDSNSDVTGTGGDDDDDEDEDYEWMPPDDSPLVTNKVFNNL